MAPSFSSNGTLYPRAFSSVHVPPSSVCMNKQEVLNSVQEAQPVVHHDILKGSEPVPRKRRNPPMFSSQRENSANGHDLQRTRLLTAVLCT